MDKGVSVEYEELIKNYGPAIQRMRSECMRNYFKESDKKYMSSEQMELLNDIAFEMREKKRNLIINHLEERIKELEDNLNEKKKQIIHLESVIYLINSD